MKRILASALAGTLLLGTAHAAPIVKGQTTITVVQDLAPAGITATPVDGAQREFETFSQPVFTFRITGGQLNDDFTGDILHSGGVTLENDDGSITLSNLIIDVEGGLVFGDVFIPGVGMLEAVDLFSFTIPSSDGGSMDLSDDDDDGDDSDGDSFGGKEAFDLIDDVSFALFYTEASVGALADVFGLQLSTSDQFGTAVTNPLPTPVPAAAFLMAPALAGVWASRRKNKKEKAA